MFLSSFPAVYSELLKLFDVREVANLVQDTLGSLPTIVHVDDALQAVKLQCIGKTVESQLYTNPGKVLGLLDETVSLESHYLHFVLIGQQKQLKRETKNFLKSIIYLDGRISLLNSQIQKYGSSNFISRKNENSND